MCFEAVRMRPYSLEFVPGRLRTQEMCNEAVCRGQDALRYVPDNLMSQEICNKATSYNPAAFFLFLTVLKHKMCNMAVWMDPYNLEFVSGHLKTKEMCNEAVRRELYTLRYVPDHLKTQEMYN